jgi:hypothetical protein
MWILFASHSNEHYSGSYSFFKGIFETEEDAVKAISLLHEDHPEFHFFIKKAVVGKIYDYAWSHK